MYLRHTNICLYSAPGYVLYIILSISRHHQFPKYQRAIGYRYDNDLPPRFSRKKSAKKKHAVKYSP